LTSPIQSLEVSYLVHSTEDADKIRSAVERTLGVEAAPVTEELDGHYGNKIVHVVHRLTGEAASSALADVARRLPSSTRDELLQNIEAMMDEHSALYVRLDRQSLVRGELALGVSEPVRVRVKPRLFLMKGGAVKFFTELLEGTA